MFVSIILCKESINSEVIFMFMIKNDYLSFFLYFNWKSLNSFNFTLGCDFEEDIYS